MPRSDRPPKKRREQIRRETKFADEHKNLPFKFLPYKAPKSKTRCFECDCGHGLWVHRSTYMIHCTECDKLKKISELEELTGSNRYQGKDRVEINMGTHKGQAEPKGPFTKR